MLFRVTKPTMKDFLKYLFIETFNKTICQWIIFLQNAKRYKIILSIYSLSLPLFLSLRWQSRNRQMLQFLNHRQLVEVTPFAALTLSLLSYSLRASESNTFSCFIYSSFIHEFIHLYKWFTCWKTTPFINDVLSILHCWYFVKFLNWF